MKAGTNNVGCLYYELYCVEWVGGEEMEWLWIQRDEEDVKEMDLYLSGKGMKAFKNQVS